MAGLPLVTASQTPKKEEAAPAAPQPAPAAQSAPQPAQPSTDAPTFEKADRNKDGQLDKSEAGMVPGLSANFERADRNKDGKLDKAEFDRGLQILQVRR